MSSCGNRYCTLGGGGSFGLHTARHLLDRGAERVVSIGRAQPKPECFTLGVGDGDPRYAY
jgi:dTDP-glucose 4,6-dehydratase